MKDTKTDFDVAIIGGGPAGAGMASYLAMTGVKCVVFERERRRGERHAKVLLPAGCEPAEQDALPHAQPAKRRERVDRFQDRSSLRSARGATGDCAIVAVGRPLSTRIRAITPTRSSPEASKRCRRRRG